MKKIIFKENIVLIFNEKTTGVEHFELKHLFSSLSLFLSVDVRRVPVFSVEAVSFPCAEYQFYKECLSLGQKKKLKNQLKTVVEILSSSGYFEDCFLQLKKHVS